MLDHGTFGFANDALSYAEFQRWFSRDETRDR